MLAKELEIKVKVGRRKDSYALRRLAQVAGVNVVVPNYYSYHHYSASRKRYYKATSDEQNPIEASSHLPRMRS